MKHIAIVTSGGDAPGTNAVIRAIARRALNLDLKVSGVVSSWEGVLEAEYLDLTRWGMHGILQDGGTILKSARTRLLMEEADAERIREALMQKGIEGIFVVGGEGSQKGALALSQTGFPVIGVPKTIDNDVLGTDYTVGFHTAVETATQSIDRVRTHTESNDRVMIVEVMGRRAGWIAAFSGIASGADYVLVPERKWRVSEVADHLRDRHTRQRRNFSLIIAAEGAIESAVDLNRQPDNRSDHLGRVFLGGVGELLARRLEDETGYECRSTNLGYLLRGGSPVAVDRLLATRLGLSAVDAMLSGERGKLIGQKRGDVVATPLHEVTSGLKLVPPEILERAAHFF